MTSSKRFGNCNSVHIHRLSRRDSSLLEIGLGTVFESIVANDWPKSILSPQRGFGQCAQQCSGQDNIHSLQVRAGMWAWSSWHLRIHAAHKAVENLQLHAWLGTSCHLEGIEFPQLPAALTRRAKPLVQNMPSPQVTSDGER